MSQQSVELLLIEDNPVDVELALHVLRKENLGQHVAVARDGEEALEFLFGTEAVPRAAASGLKLILLDLKLPKVDGMELLRRLRADLRTRTVPVAIFSSSAVASDVLQSYTLGANSYIVKPVGYRSFAEAITTLGRYWLRLNHRVAPELVETAAGASGQMQPRAQGT